MPMRRLSALALLITVAFPFARAPLCQAGQHEHQDEHVMPHTGGQTVFNADDGMDCHVQMKCQVGTELTVLPSALRRTRHWVRQVINVEQPHPVDRIPERRQVRRALYGHGTAAR